jgi:hypothetical protein
MTTRDEAAIANAMLLGDLISLPFNLDFRYNFSDGQHGVSRWHRTAEQAAWMFLLDLGYGIEPDGLGLIKLPTKNSSK